MKALTNAFPFFPRISRYCTMDKQDAPERALFRALIILTLIFLVLIFLLRSSAHTVENHDVTPDVLNTDVDTSQPSDDPSSPEALSGSQGPDIPFRNGDGITLYIPYSSDLPLLDGKEFSPSPEDISVAFRSSHGSRDAQGGTVDDDGTGGQRLNSEGYGGNSGSLRLPRSPSWASNLDTSGVVDFGEASGPGHTYDRGPNGPGNEAWTGPGNNPGQDFDGGLPKGILPIVRQDPTQAVPEPGSLVLFASTLASFFFIRKARLG
jgi:hypothetical protein